MSSVTLQTLQEQYELDISVLTATKKDKVIVAAFLAIGVPLLILGGIGLLSYGGHTPLHLAIPKGGCISLVAVGGVMTIGGLVMTAAMMKRHLDFKKEAFSVPMEATMLPETLKKATGEKIMEPIKNLNRPIHALKIGWYDLDPTQSPPRLLIMNMHVYDSRKSTKNGLC